MSRPGSDTRYSTKTIKYIDKEGTSVVIMLTSFKGEGNEVLEEAGYRGDYLLMSNMEMGADHYSTNPWAFSAEIEGDGDNHLRLLLQKINSGTIPFGSIEDGGVYDPIRIKNLV
jgi:hypothetical protein